MPLDPSLIDPEVRQRQRLRRRGLKIGGAILLVLVVGLFVARPVRNAIKGWQARRHAEKAFRFIETEKWNDAQKEASAAYQLRPTEPAALRAIARFLSRTRQAEALGFWKAVREKEPLTREDLRDEAASAIAAGETSTANIAVQELEGPREGGPRAADHLLAAQVAAQKNDREAATALLDKALSDPQVTERQQLQAALFQLALVNPGNASELRTAAWTRLSQLARGRGEVALDALSILAQHTLSAPNEIASDPAILPDEEVIRALEAHPLSRAPQKLLALDLQMHADQSQRETFIAQAIDTWRGSDNEALAVLARWLNSKGEYQRELDTVPLERALQTRELFLRRLDALGALGNWAEIKRLLQTESFPLDPMIEAMYLARCNQQLGEVTAGENNWQRALEAAGGDGQKLLTLADYAEKNGAAKIAESAYDIVGRDNPRVRIAQGGRLRLAQQRRDTAKMHAVLAEMLQQWPHDTAIQNDEAYTRLLLARAKDEGRRMKDEAGNSSPRTSNQELITVEQLAERLVRLEPASLPHRTLLALARLKQGRAEAAMEIYENLTVPPNTTSPAAVAVHAAVLAASGRDEDARVEAGAVNWEQLLPDEQALIEPLRRTP